VFQLVSSSVGCNALPLFGKLKILRETKTRGGDDKRVKGGDEGTKQ